MFTYDQLLRIKKDFEYLIGTMMFVADKVVIINHILITPDDKQLVENLYNEYIDNGMDNHSALIKFNMMGIELTLVLVTDFADPYILYKNFFELAQERNLDLTKYQHQ